MNLFNFFKKLIKTVVKLIFPKKYHRVKKGNKERSTKTRARDVHRVGTPPARISPAVLPVNTVKRTIQKPERQPAEPGRTEEDGVDGYEEGVDGEVKVEDPSVIDAASTAYREVKRSF